MMRELASVIRRFLAETRAEIEDGVLAFREAMRRGR